MLVRIALPLVPCALLAASLIGSGMKARDVFLAVGDLRAPNRLAPWLPPWSWTAVGPALLVLLASGLSVQLALTVRPDTDLASRALAALPLALLSPPSTPPRRSSVTGPCCSPGSSR